MDAGLARRLATRVLALAQARTDTAGVAVVLRSLARARTDTAGVAVVLRSFARADSGALRLARSRCLAALDQGPGADAARRRWRCSTPRSTRRRSKAPTGCSRPASPRRSRAGSG